MRQILFISLIVFILFSCQKNEAQKSQENITANTHKVIVEEVIQAGSYTYLKVKEGSDQYWTAITKRQIEKGEEFYYSGALEMKNFESKELQRTFDTIYFIQEISKQPSATANNVPATVPHGKQMPKQKKDISVEPVTGGITIEKLYSHRNSYADKTVKIRGQVTKFNANIMGKNWVHIQDGTKDSENFDLTITTKEIVKVGDVIIFEGKITLNKNLGAGYFYDVIMEEAKKLTK